MSTDPNFQNAWFSTMANDGLNEHFNEIRTYAYLVFDSLDTNNNGYIEMEELNSALELPNMSEREKSFITFLLNNHSSITNANPDGISRKDIEAYFKLIAGLL
jgi:hypothetical protein